MSEYGLTVSIQDSMENSNTIENCIQSFFKKNELLEDYKCDKCKQNNVVYETDKIVSLPENLVLSIKRFNYNGTKNSKNVSFRLKFKFCGAVYALYAVVNHYGGTCGGHYTSYIKKNDSWYEFDDSTITELKQIKTGNAYILFYKKESDE
jgi:ubiquitin carboxyl-terminal hydrolase 8